MMTDNDDDDGDDDGDHGDDDDDGYKKKKEKKKKKSTVMLIGGTSVHECLAARGHECSPSLSLLTSDPRQSRLHLYETTLRLQFTSLLQSTLSPQQVTHQIVEPSTSNPPDLPQPVSHRYFLRKRNQDPSHPPDTLTARKRQRCAALQLTSFSSSSRQVTRRY